MTEEEVLYVRTADSERDKAFFDGGLLQRTPH